jgi:hypothetical protein
MKVTDCFATPREMDNRTGSGISLEFRKNVGVNLRMTCRALAGLSCDKQIERERCAAARTGEIGGHLAYDTGREVKPQIKRKKLNHRLHRFHRFEEGGMGVCLSILFLSHVS